jgi:hypothetical protein
MAKVAQSEEVDDAQGEEEDRRQSPPICGTLMCRNSSFLKVTETRVGFPRTPSGIRACARSLSFRLDVTGILVAVEFTFD